MGQEGQDREPRNRDMWCSIESIHFTMQIPRLHGTSTRSTPTQRSASLAIAVLLATDRAATVTPALPPHLP